MLHVTAISQVNRRNSEAPAEKITRDHPSQNLSKHLLTVLKSSQNTQLRFHFGKYVFTQNQ